MINTKAIIYVLLLFVVACAWFLLRRQRLVAAGILIGVFVALKPIFVFWPLMLFVTGHSRASVWAGLAFATVSLLPMVVFGPDIYGQWFDLVLSEADDRKAAFPNATVLAIGYLYVGERRGLGLLRPDRGRQVLGRPGNTDFIPVDFAQPIPQWIGTITPATLERSGVA